MTDDLVQRLRERAGENARVGYDSITEGLLWSAADALERLQADNQRLKAQQYLDECASGGLIDGLRAAVDEARAEVVRLQQALSDLAAELEAPEPWDWRDFRRAAAAARAVLNGDRAVTRAKYVCPCLRCPSCGYVDDDREHPEDGLAGPCAMCRFYEWWAHAGPFMDGRHITTADEERRWNAHDSAVLNGDQQ